jgi:hypothetical protein
VTVFSPSTSVFPRHYHSTISPLSSSSAHCTYQKDASRPSQKCNIQLEFGYHRIGNCSALHVSESLVVHILFSLVLVVTSQPCDNCKQIKCLSTVDHFVTSPRALICQASNTGGSKMEGQRYCRHMMYCFLHLISHLCVVTPNRPLPMYRKLTGTILVGNITEHYREAPNITNRLIGGNQKVPWSITIRSTFSVPPRRIKMHRGVTKCEPQAAHCEDIVCELLLRRSACRFTA